VRFYLRGGGGENTIEYGMRYRNWMIPVDIIFFDDRQKAEVSRHKIDDSNTGT